MGLITATKSLWSAGIPRLAVWRRGLAGMVFQKSRAGASTPPAYAGSDGPAEKSETAGAGPTTGNDVSDTAQVPVIESAAVIELLKGSSVGVREACGMVESDFLALGGGLQAIYSESETLTATIVEVLSTDDDQTINGALKDIHALAVNAIAELNHRREKLAADLQGLNGIQGDLHALSQQNNGFKQVAKNLKMVGLNISIESARTELAKSTFQALAEEITQLAQTVYQVAGDISDDTQAVKMNLESIQVDINARMRHLDGLIASAEKTVQAALVEVENLMSMTLSVLDGIGEKSREISKQVGHLVVSIQIHDNISQRVAHINTSIDEAVAIIETSTGIDLPASALEPVYGRVYGINRLQIAQLKIIEEDVTEVRDKSVSALDGLLSAVQAVANPEGFDLGTSGSVYQFDTTNRNHPVAILRQALEQLIALFDEGLEGINRLAQAREETGRTIARMGQHIDKVRDINFEIHLKALNAVIKSTQLGDTGKAIEAIVNEMKELAEQSNTTIQSTTAIMETISESSEAMDQTTHSDAADIDSSGCDLREGIDGFTAACVAFKEKSQSAVAMGQAIQKKIAEAQQRLSFFDSMLAAFDRHRKGLETLDQHLTPFAGAVPDDWVEEEKNIASRYTMQRELDAHSHLLDESDQHGGMKENSFEQVDKSNGADTDAFDDNVELF